MAMPRAVTQASLHVLVLLAIVDLFAYAIPEKAGGASGFKDVNDMRVMKAMSWWYDWGAVANADAQAFGHANRIEYVPMQWARWGIDGLPGVASLANASALLGFNEPTHIKQGNLSPEDAAGLWHYLETAATKYQLRLGSPSASTCGVDCVLMNPFDWWDRFFKACTHCQVDFMAVHMYTCNGEAFGRFLNDVRTKYGLPMWVTETACPAGPGPHEDQQIAFMKAALGHMDAAPDIERYAWFAPRNGPNWLGESASLLVPGKYELTALGQLYLQPGVIPSEDRTVDLTTDTSAAATLIAKAADGGESWAALCKDCVDERKSRHCANSVSPPANSFCGHCHYTCGTGPRYP